jgi:hypothetical protein
MLWSDKWVQAVTLLTCILEMPGSSLDRDTDYPVFFRGLSHLLHSNSWIVPWSRTRSHPLQFIIHDHLVFRSYKVWSLRTPFCELQTDTCHDNTYLRIKKMFSSDILVGGRVGCFESILHADHENVISNGLSLSHHFFSIATTSVICLKSTKMYNISQRFFLGSGKYGSERQI